MEVCRMRNTPVIVFINKMDRDGQDPFDLQGMTGIVLRWPKYLILHLWWNQNSDPIH